MSDQLTAAAQAMNVPEPIVERSARARAAASGMTYEEVLAAWAGGGAVAASAPATEAPASEPEAAPAEAPTAEESAAAPASEAPAPAAAPAASPAPAAAPVAVAAFEEAEEEPVEPLPLGERVRIAGRVGAWTGAVLGLLGLVFGSTWLLGAASVAGEEGAYTPAVEVTTSRFLLGATLLSIVFGVVVAAFSRGAAGWLHPGARLEGRFKATVAMGIGLGLVLGVAAGAVMVSAFGEPIENVEGMVLIRMVPAVFVVALGGAALGWLTAALVQVIGVPVGVQDEDAAEIEEVRGRLRAAVSIPLAAVLLLAFIVIPLGLVFIRSNEMASGGAALLAIFAAASILGIAAISASRPTMRITFGEFLVAVAGVATVVLIIFAVIQTRAEPSEEATEEPAATEETAQEEGDVDAIEEDAEGDALLRRIVL
ncbi:MAG TPA: hypothetical protein VF377_08040 [Acidimicrobiia bacterium]|jgi:MFS family permease